MLVWNTGMMMGMAKMDGYKDDNDRNTILIGYLMYFTVAFYFGAKILLSHSKINETLLLKLFQKIEYQSEFEIILQNLKQSIVIISSNNDT